MVASGDWRRARPQYSSSGLDICGEEVVAFREKSLQELLAQAVCNYCGQGARLLETGYGLGMTQSTIASTFTGEHWIIEGNQWIAAQACQNNVRLSLIVCDIWEHFVSITPDSSFHGLIFDPYIFDFQIGYSGASWRQRFAFSLAASIKNLLRVMAKDASIGFINFEPSQGSDWLLEAFANRVVVSDRIRPDVTSGDLAEAEVWVVRKKG